MNEQEQKSIEQHQKALKITSNICFIAAAIGGVLLKLALL